MKKNKLSEMMNLNYYHGIFECTLVDLFLAGIENSMNFLFFLGNMKEIHS